MEGSAESKPRVVESPGETINDLTVWRQERQTAKDLVDGHLSGEGTVAFGDLKPILVEVIGKPDSLRVNLGNKKGGSSRVSLIGTGLRPGDEVVAFPREDSQYQFFEIYPVTGKDGMETPIDSVRLLDGRLVKMGWRGVAWQLLKDYLKGERLFKELREIPFEVTRSRRILIENLQGKKVFLFLPVRFGLPEGAKLSLCPIEDDPLGEVFRLTTEGRNLGIYFYCKENQTFPLLDDSREDQRAFVSIGRARRLMKVHGVRTPELYTEGDFNRPMQIRGPRGDLGWSFPKGSPEESEPLGIHNLQAVFVRAYPDFNTHFPRDNDGLIPVDRRDNAVEFILERVGSETKFNSVFGNSPSSRRSAPYFDGSYQLALVKSFSPWGLTFDFPGVSLDGISIESDAMRGWETANAFVANHPEISYLKMRDLLKDAPQRKFRNKRGHTWTYYRVGDLEAKYSEFTNPQEVNGSLSSQEATAGLRWLLEGGDPPV